jgi:hypothetical protein
MLMPLAAGIFRLRMIDVLMEVSLQRLSTTGRIGVEPPPLWAGEVSGCLPRADGDIPACLHDDSPATAYPCDHGRPVFVIMAPAGLALRTATPRAASHRPLPAGLRLALVAGGGLAFSGCHGASPLPRHLVGQGHVAKPPAPARAGTARAS